MKIDHARFLAVLVLVATPLLGAALIAHRWQGNCSNYIHPSYFPFAVLAMLLVLSDNPFRTVAACIAYCPIGYVFATEPCTAARSQGAGGLLYLIAPVFVVFILVCSFVGGFMLRILFGMKTPAELQAAGPGRIGVSTGAGQPNVPPDPG